MNINNFMIANYWILSEVEDEGKYLSKNVVDGFGVISFYRLLLYIDIIPHMQISFEVHQKSNNSDTGDAHFLWGIDSLNYNKQLGHKHNIVII